MRYVAAGLFLLVLSACPGGTTTKAGSYTIGGAVNGLTDGSLLLSNNGADPLTVRQSGRFTFATAMKQGDRYDVRGLMWSTVPGGCSFMTRFTPNKFNDYLGLRTSDYLNQVFFCTPEPPALPCTFATSDVDRSAFAGSRSRHPGGVNVLFGDGGVRFIKDSIAHPTWIGINTIKGNEAISADAY